MASAPVVPGELPLGAVRRFLQSPLQGAARDLLRLREVDWSDEAVREDELFESEQIASLALLRDVVLESLGTAPDGSVALAGDRL